MNILDTTSDLRIYESLADILAVREDDVRTFLLCNLQKYINYWEYQIDLQPLYKEFGLDEEFALEGVTIHHVTTRLGEVKKETFNIDNLEKLLLGQNTVTEFFKEYEIDFKREQGISVYYKGKKKDKYEGYADGRLRNRLDNLNDSCVNGFLFAEWMDNSYIGLTGMPEIFSDLLSSLDRRDIQSEYFKNMKCYMATIDISIEDFIFDDYTHLKSPSEKTRLILQYVIAYLCFKFSKDEYYPFKNTIIRLPDNKNVKSSEIRMLRQIFDYKEIFKY